MAYTITGEKYGVVRFEPLENGIITKESYSASNKITDNPVETGESLTDHAFNNADQFSITGVVVGNADEARNKLRQMKEQFDVVTYSGKMRVDNLMIQSYSENPEYKNKNGFGFSITFRKVKFGVAEYVEMGEVPLMSRQDKGKSSATTSAPKNDGLKTTVSANISNSAYANYINSYNSKPASSAGPTTRETPAYNGIKAR